MKTNKTYAVLFATVLAATPFVIATAGRADTPASDAPGSDSAGTYIDDSAITTKVKAALLKDDAVKSFEIHVTTYRGVVQLSGDVDNSDQKSAAKNDAASVDGVKSVTNNINVKSS